MTAPSECIVCCKRRPRTQLDEHGVCCYCRGQLVKDNERHRAPGTTAAQRRDASRRRQLAKYGLDAETYGAMLMSQRGVCALCNGDNGGRLLHIDHDHETGAVRALLCSPCNTGLGNFRDRSDILRRAAEYIDHHSAPR